MNMVSGQVRRLNTSEMPAGFKAAGVACGIKGREKNDLALIYSETDTAAAGAFTENRLPAAPVRLSRKVMAGGRCRAVIINSGSANACTGVEGYADAERMAGLTAEALKIDPGLVAVCSTGRIGDPLPMDKIEGGIAALAEIIRTGGNGAAPEAIMTTDTGPKQTAVEFEEEGITARIRGMAKGAGMIYPRMRVEGLSHATMLAFIITDVEAEAETLREALSRSLEQSFNRITVDGDTSTNDTVILMANGRSGVKAGVRFREALDCLTRELARMIVADGEGATRFIEIEVRSAQSREDARVAAAAVANSNLLKCAFYGESPNWGRMLAALGYSGAEIEEGKVAVFLDEVEIIRDGLLREVPEDIITGKLKEKFWKFVIDLGLGEGNDFYYTCDLTPEYVEINKR